jgi:hypothetical protein
VTACRFPLLPLVAKLQLRNVPDPKSLISNPGSVLALCCFGKPLSVETDKFCGFLYRLWARHTYNVWLGGYPHASLDYLLADNYNKTQQKD